MLCNIVPIYQRTKDLISRLYLTILGKETELLRFDCFDQRPHYHYGPEIKNEITYLDQTTSGNPIGWTIKNLRSRFPNRLERAGYEDIANLVQQPDQM